MFFGLSLHRETRQLLALALLDSLYAMPCHAVQIFDFGTAVVQMDPFAMHHAVDQHRHPAESCCAVLCCACADL
jgi:hypothetical protein